LTDRLWQRQWEVFHAALDLPAEARHAFVESQCGEDPELHGLVLQLLAAHEAAHPLLDEPVLHAAGLVDDLDPESLVGTSIDGYVIRSVIGEGGMGVVYEAEQARLGRRVALKLVRLGMDTQQVIARFEAERLALAKMQHRNIAQVLDAGATDSGRPYFVMELVEGEPITDYCDEQRLDVGQRLGLFLAVCAGVQHAHQKGVIHRDLKPGNVLVTREDGKAVPKIIDFGIATAVGTQAPGMNRLTQAGLFVGTPDYMSPEQAGLSETGVDTRSDVYSLGMLLYELLVGALPFEGDELRRAAYDELRRRIREDAPTRPSLRLSTLEGKAEELARSRGTDGPALIRLLKGDLDWITMRALEKEPDRRYASPSELAADLRRYLGDEPVEAGPPSASYRIGKFIRRHTLVVVLSSVVILSLFIGAGATAFGMLRAREAERVAQAEARTSEEVTRFLASLFRVSEPSAADVGSITAREVLDRGVQRIGTELAGEPAVQSRLMQEMGKVYAQLGVVDEAERLYRKALAIRRQQPGFTDAQVAETLSGLAGVEHLAGRHEAAIAGYRQAINLAAGSAGQEKDILWLATVYRSLGGVYETVGQPQESLATLRQARTLLEDAGLADTAEYGRVLRNIGISHWSTNDFEAARAAYEEALRVFDHALEPGHPDVSYVVNSLAILNYNLGDLDAARPLLERELANLQRTLGPEHPNTASIMNNLGLLLLDLGLPDEARPKLLESLRIREAALGPEHEDVATSLLNLAKLQVLDGDPEAARASLERCLAIREKTLGPNHPYVAGTLERYAEVLETLGETGESLAMKQRAEAIRAAGG
jgi:serine/threonine protein kinase/tetratricopeptide (TPR) repeat protein